MVRPNEKIEDTQPAPRYDETILRMAVAGIQKQVMFGVLRLYDRYINVELINGRTYMSLEDFLNQLIVRGLIAYDQALAPIETAAAGMFVNAAKQKGKDDGLSGTSL